jgi:hypothetical protein
VEHDPVTAHLATGFHLEGAHVLIRCESCHVRGIFAGTPRLCTGCHENGRGFIDADVKPPDHIPTREQCEVCHDQRSGSAQSTSTSRRPTVAARAVTTT